MSNESIPLMDASAFIRCALAIHSRYKAIDVGNAMLVGDQSHTTKALKQASHNHHLLDHCPH
jgi:hypothetical protein